VLVIALAVSIGALAKGVTGLGLPLIAIPVTATFLGVEVAVVVMIVPTFVTNCWLLWTYRRWRGTTTHLGVMVGFGSVGTVLGTVFLTAVDPAVPALILGGVASSYLVLRLARPSFALADRAVARSAAIVGFLGGGLQGATGVAGPLVSTYVHATRPTREVFLLSVTAMFQVFALAQMATFAALGRYDATNLALALLAMVPALLLLPVGMWLGQRMKPERFDQFILALLAISAVKLLVDGVTGLLG
jgi:uncharacterized protein